MQRVNRESAHCPPERANKKYADHPPLVECVQTVCDENVEHIRLVRDTALPATRSDSAPAATGFLLDIVKDRNQAVPAVDGHTLRARAAVRCAHRQETSGTTGERIAPPQCVSWL